MEDIIVNDEIIQGQNSRARATWIKQGNLNTIFHNVAIRKNRT